MSGKPNYELGLVSVSFRDRSPHEIVRAMKEAGLTAVEWGSDVHAPCCDPDRLKELKGLQDMYEIRCSSYGTYFRIGVTPKEELPRYIDAAKTLGTDVLRLWCGDRNSECYDEDDRKALFEECRSLAETADSSGVTLCMECHQKTFTNRPESALLLMNEVDSPRFRMYWQPQEYETDEENLRYALLIRPYVRHIHVFYWIGAQHLPLAESSALWKKYLNSFFGDRTLLLEFMPDNRIESLKAEAEALRNIVK